MTYSNLFLQISRHIVTVFGESYVLFEMFIFNFIIEKITLCFVVFLYGKNRFIFTIYFYIICLFCIPGTCVFYNSWEKIHSWSNNQLSCGILRKIFTMHASDYERVINYDWPYV